MDKPLVIHWFRQDLRLADNPALFDAAREGRVLPIYVLEEAPERYAMGAASRAWLHHSLERLNESLDGRLNLYAGDAQSIILELVERRSVAAVYWNRCYEPWRQTRDAALETALEKAGIEAETRNGSLLWEPWEVRKDDGTPYRVFTPFYRRGCLKAPEPRRPLGAPELQLAEADAKSSTIEALELLPNVRWDEGMMRHWQVGEAAAGNVLDRFLTNGLANYAKGRDHPAQDSVSRLSPYLHFGEISPNTAWYAVKDGAMDNNADRFMSELGWREFSYSLLEMFPDLPEKPLQHKFEAFPWADDPTLLRAWQRGETGYPMVDAGMRELWQTGYMHNRVRMIVGSFLVKNLLQHWHAGERWFWDCLVDADLANNSASWQWVSGCGADAAPYFRIFNPTTQAKKFDPDGTYIRRYLPELADLPDRYVHNPFEAPAEALRDAGVELGKDYPRPIVDLKQTRQRALDAFSSLKAD